MTRVEVFHLMTIYTCEAWKTVNNEKPTMQCRSCHRMLIKYEITSTKVLCCVVLCCVVLCCGVLCCVVLCLV